MTMVMTMAMATATSESHSTIIGSIQVMHVFLEVEGHPPR